MKKCEKKIGLFFLIFPNFSKKKGFTLVELVLVVGLFTFLFGMGAVALGNVTSAQSLRADADRLVTSLREAHTNAVAQYRDSAWGVHLDTTTNPDRFILFKGSSYAARDSSFDQVNGFHNNISFGDINLSSGKEEVVFSKRSGNTSDYGMVRLDSQDEQFNITINNLGLIDFDF